MSHIVCEPCVKCKFTDCVAVCPVECFHEGVNMLVIDPEVCIDCGLCPSECPVDAICSDRDIPNELEGFVEINAKYAQIWPIISAQKEPLEGANKAMKEENKKNQIDPNPFKKE